MRLLACLIVAPQRGYDEPAILSYAISSFCPTSADGLQDSTSPGYALTLLVMARHAPGAAVAAVLARPHRRARGPPIGTCRGLPRARRDPHGRGSRDSRLDQGRARC